VSADSQLLTGRMAQIDAAASDSAALPLVRGEINVRVTRRIEDVEEVWAALSSGPIESPGQSYDFIKQWVMDRKLPLDAQRYVVGEVDGRPVALLPLHRKVLHGISVFTWFPGANVGCYSPVADYEQLANLGILGRAALWQAMTGQLAGGDLIYLRSVPRDVGGHPGLFDELGVTLDIETLYRARFSSWAECDREQRTRSRRKHDRQQGERLAAMGQVEFETITDAGQMAPVIDTMFRQRSARFRAQGIRDPFVCDNLMRFYHGLAKPGSGTEVRLHVLRLNGAIVAVRYNIVHGDRMFCLISSMSDDLAIQNGSPGKQCLLNVMQTVFDQGIGVFDMGSGFTDEKRHWCNEQIPLRQHYIGLNQRGMMIVAAHRNFQRLRAWAKANNSIRVGLRGLRQKTDRLLGRGADHSTPSDQL
jgi:CelD/BcsL family acetyltransferase involved in cellulose biosynthesis